MPIENKQVDDKLSSSNSSADFEQALLEIDASFDATMNELKRLHQKKIDIILLYKKAQKEEQLLKIRNELK